MIVLLAVLVLFILIGSAERGKRMVREARRYGPEPRHVRRLGRLDQPYDWESDRSA